MERDMTAGNYQGRFEECVVDNSAQGLFRAVIAHGAYGGHGMPARKPIRAGIAYEFNGIPFTLITAKGKELAYLAVATESDGLIDGPVEVLAAAEAWRAEMESPIRGRIDKSAPVGKDKSNSCPPSQASG
jgi:hypothetical protein